MLGKPEWFQRRKYGGWGVSPRTWQGWLYLAVAVGVVMLVQVLPIGGQARVVTTFILAAILAVDLVHIMLTIPKDERDRIHEAFAERNALWVMLAVLTAGIGYQVAVSVVKRSYEVDPIILAALIAAVIAKAATNIYLDRRD